MALTAIATSDAYCVKAWHKKFEKEIIKDLYFTKFKGDNGGPVLMLDELQGSPGDVIHYDLVKALTGDGITGNQTLEGKEEEMLFYDDTITLQLRGNAVSDDGPLSNQRSHFSISANCANALKDWLDEKIDGDFFASLASSLTKCFYIDGTSASITASTAATAKAALTAANSKLTPQLVRWARTWSKSGGNGGQPRFQPIRVGGGEHFIALLGLDASEDLKANAEWQQSVREAEKRGSDNPLFSGAFAMLDGIVFHMNEGITSFTDGGGAAVRGSHCMLLGKNAIAFGWAKKPTITEGSDKYKMKFGKAIHAVYGVGKSVFNSLDYAVTGVTVACSNVIGL